MKKFAVSFFGSLATASDPLVHPDPNFDWHNGPHGDVILTPLQKKALRRQGVDVSTYKVDTTVQEDKGVLNSFNKWTALNSEGKIIVPYYLDETVTESFRAQVHAELVDFSYSLGCIEMVHDQNRTNPNGVHVFGETSFTSGGNSCWSYVGKCSYCGLTSYPEMKPGWQALRLPDWCIQYGGTHHEFLHAIGLLHEQDRPDFEEHFHPQAGGGGISEDAWFDTGHVLEPSSNLMYAGFSLKNGGGYAPHKLLTTTDAEQVWQRYCAADFSQFPLPPRAQCPTTDVVGAYRPIFEHRFCDGFASCFNGEDEGWSNSVIVRCEGGKATVLPCGRSDCDFATQTCENSADETTYICIDKETTTPEPTEPPNTTPPDTTEPPNTTPPVSTETSYTITGWSTETTTKADEDYGEEAVDEISNIIDDIVLDADLDAKTLKRVKKAIKNLEKLVKKLLKHSEKLVKKDGCTFEAPGLGPISGGCEGLLDAELNLEAWTRAYGKHCKKDKNSFVDRLISKYLTKSMETINESTGC